MLFALQNKSRMEAYYFEMQMVALDLPIMNEMR